MKRLFIGFMLFVLALPLMGQQRVATYEGMYNTADDGNALGFYGLGNNNYFMPFNNKAKIGVYSTTDFSTLSEVYFDTLGTETWGRIRYLVGSGDYSFGGTGNAGINTFGVLDFSTPSVPVVVDSFASAIYMDNPQVSAFIGGAEDYVAVACRDDDMLTVMDVSTPTVITRHHSYSSSANIDQPYRMAARSDGDYLYVHGRGINSITAINSSNVGALSYTSKIVDAGIYNIVTDMSIMDNDSIVMGISYTNDLFWVLNVADSSALTSIVQLDDSLATPVSGSLSPDNQYYAVANINNGAVIIDVSDFTSPFVVDTIDVSNYCSTLKSITWVNDSTLAITAGFQDSPTADVLFYTFNYYKGTPGGEPAPVDSVQITTISRTQMTMLGHGYYAVAYRGASSYGEISTYHVDDSDEITFKNNWIFTTGTISYPDIVYIPGSNYSVVSYDSSSYATIALAKIDTANGTITNSFYDYEKMGPTAALTVDLLDNSHVVAIYPDSDHGSNAYRAFTFFVDIDNERLTPVDTAYVTGQGRTTDFAAVNRVGTSDYFVFTQPSASNYPKAIVHEISNGEFSTVGIDSLVMMAFVPTNFRAVTTPIDINEKYGFVWVGNDNLSFIRGYAYTVNDATGTITPEDDFGGINININDSNVMTSLGDSTFVVFGAAGGSLGAWYSFDFNLYNETFDATPTISDELTGTTGDRWDMRVHNYSSNTNNYTLFQSFYSYGVRTWDIYGDGTYQGIAGDGVVSPPSPAGGIGGFSKWNTLDVSLWNQKTLSKLNGI